MKKFALIFASLMAVMVSPMAFAAQQGVAGSFKFDGLQKPDDDEFLYENKKEYDLCKAGYENTHTCGDGHVFECDTINSKSYKKGQTIVMLPGHYFKGKRVDQKVEYECSESFLGNDYWKEKNDNVCHTDKFGEIPVGKCVTGDNGKCKQLTAVDCSGLQLTDTAGTVFNGICRENVKFVCKAIKCRDGLKADSATGKCVADTSAQNSCKTPWGNISVGKIVQSGGSYRKLTKKECKDNGWTLTSDKGTVFQGICRQAPTLTCKAMECESGYKPNASTGACEKDSSDSNTPAKPNKCDLCNTLGDKAEICSACCAKPSSETYWHPTAHTCSCVKGGTFTKDAATGAWSCVTAPTPVPPVVGENPCTSARMDNLNEWAIKCKDDSEIMSLIDTMRNACKPANPSKEIVDAIYAEIQSKEPWNCKAEQGGGSTTITIEMEQDASRRNVDKAHSKIKSMMETFKVSVWRDSEGKFNTSRLVSDSVAGVVLGTAGGLITSNIIKKNQIKGGFEDLSCVIGGQTVANWGDEFSVGMK